MPARLTDSHARNARAKAKPYKLTDGNGLFLLVKPNGKRCWRFRYRIDGVENLFAVGDYPQLGLQQARQARDQARELVNRGIHPAHQRKADKLTTAIAARDTFDFVAREWIERNRVNWTAYYTRQVETVLTNDVLPHIGKLPIGSVKPAHLLEIMNRVANRGAETIAILVRQWCSAIFRYAVATLRAESDPAAVLKGAVRREKVKHKEPIAAKELGKLTRAIDDSQTTAAVRIALKLLLLTFVRPGELRGASWEEFDFDSREWRIPKERMKMREAHLVPLSEQACVLLNELKSIATSVVLLFPNVRDPQRAMSPTTLNRALERMGYQGKFSAHGFRATASTLLNEMGYRPDVIERQLAHRERNSVRASYNRASYLPERRALMQDWANFIDARLVSDNVTPIMRNPSSSLG